MGRWDECGQRPRRRRVGDAGAEDLRLQFTAQTFQCNQLAARLIVPAALDDNTPRLYLAHESTQVLDLEDQALDHAVAAIASPELAQLVD